MKLNLNTPRHIRIVRIIFLLYLIIIILLSILPINGVSSPLNDTHIVKIRLDYLLHTLIFLPFLPLAMCSMSVSSEISKQFIYILSLLLIGIIFAIITEIIQFYLPFRTFNVNDLIANILGVILGSSLFLLIKHKIRPPINIAH